jgi:cytochrome b
MRKQSNATQIAPTVRVWDWGVRLLHWWLAIAIVAAWIYSSDEGRAHEIAGYAALSALLIRIGWGTFYGRRSARLSRCLRFPRQLSRYVRRMMNHCERRYLGHNPLGSVMVYALLICVAIVCFTGWLFTTDRFWGYGWLATLHFVVAWTLVGLVAAHVAGVLFTALRHRENLIAAMITGNKSRRIKLPFVRLH